MIFRLADAAMYTDMDKACHNPTIDRGMALHKLIRLMTMSLGGQGYLTFMGNEFGHPEWIDFPREGNGWSFHYCRRQWSLADNPDLKYQYLNNFEKAMVKMAKDTGVLSGWDQQLYLSNWDKVMVYKKGDAIFAYNLHCHSSFDGYFLPMPEEGDYQVLMSSDDYCFGGHGRIYHNTYTATKHPDGRIGFRIYLPSRTAVVFKKVN